MLAVVCTEELGQGPPLGLGGGEGFPGGGVLAEPESARVLLGVGERSYLGGGEVVASGVGPFRGLRSGGSSSGIDMFRELRKF